MIRQKNIHIVLAITLLLGFVVDIVEAGSKKRRGTAGAQELLIPTGSRGTAMAGAYVAGISGLEAVEWNMAGLAGMNKSGQALSSYSNWIADIGVNSAAIAYKFGGNNVFGVSLKSLDFGDIPVTTAVLPDGYRRDVFSKLFNIWISVFEENDRPNIFWYHDEAY